MDLFRHGQLNAYQQDFDARHHEEQRSAAARVCIKPKRLWSTVTSQAWMWSNMDGSSVTVGAAVIAAPKIASFCSAIHLRVAR